MEKHTLSSAAKSLMDFNNNDFEKPISFSNTPAHTAEYQSVQKLAKIPTVVWDAIRYLNLTDCPEFDSFLATKQSSNTITTDRDIFNEAAFNADMREIERQYEAETQFLKAHPPKSTSEAASWQARLQQRDLLRSNLPKATDSKYHSKERVVVTFAGPQCKQIITDFKAKCDAIEAKYIAAAKTSYIEARKLTMDEETFKFIKTMRRLNQIDLAKIPVNEIRMGANKDASDDLFRALSFESVESYNNSLSAYNPLITSAEMEDERLSCCNADVQMAANALLSYCIEFKALKELNDTYNSL